MVIENSLSLQYFKRQIKYLVVDVNKVQEGVMISTDLCYVI